MFMTPWMKPSSIHCATRLAWRPDDGVQERAVGLPGVRDGGVVAGDGVVGERAQAFGVASCREELESAYAEMAGGDAGKDRAGHHGFAQDALTGSDGGERAGGGDAKRGHGFADDVLTQHGA